jgi:hypothetical protein
MSIADKLTYLAGTKTAIKDAIEAKGVTVGNIPFRQYAGKIGDIEGGGSPAPYSRPADWLTMPTLTEGQQKVVGLHAVFPHDSNFCAFTVSGAYTVDWGDGSAPQNYASGEKAYHVFDYGDLGAETECTRGYRQALVTITPQAGQNLTSVNFSVKHNQSGLPNNYSTGWLDVRAVGASIANIAFGSSSVVRNAMLEIFEFIGSNNITTDFRSMFYNCYSLQSIPQLDTSSGTDFSQMFRYCYSLQSIPQLDTSSGENFGFMFYYCYSLQSIPQLDTSRGTHFGSMFYYCYSLQSIPQLDTSRGTNFSDMFRYCYSLASAPLQGTPRTISFSGCRLSRQALVDIFNGLATASQTIIITGNWGAQYLDATDRAIATNKGWTIVD